MSFEPLLAAALAAQEVTSRPVCAAASLAGLLCNAGGEPRYTADVDLFVLVEAGQEARVTQALFARFTPRISAAADF